MSDNRYEILKNLHSAQGELAYLLELFGDTIAEREGYKDLDGMDAVHFYLIHKFNWLPRDVRTMSYTDIRFVLTEEMRDWTSPKESRI